MDQPFEDDTLLARWLSGELSETEKQELEQHPDFPQWKKIVEASDRLLTPEFDSKGSWEKLKAARASQPMGRQGFLQRIALGVAAAVLLFIGFRYWPSQSAQRIEAPVGEQIKFTLPDKSQVTLHAASEITWDEKTWPQERRLQLRGEAYFSVRSGEAFTVQTSQGDVKVLGTRFNVFDRPEEGYVVTCYEGKVGVQRRDEPSLILQAGEEASLQGNKLGKDSHSGAGSPSWTRGETLFRNKPSKLVFKELSRLYGVEIEFNKVSSKPYTGPLPHDNLKNALDIISKTLNLRYEIVHDKLVRIQED